MDVSIRSALTAGVAGLSASVIALSPSLTPLPQFSISQASATVASHAAVDLRAVTQPLLPQVPTTAQLLDALASLLAAAVTPGIITTPGLIDLANAIDTAYVAIEEWVAYAFEVVSYVLGWIPYGWVIDDQIFVVYNFVESLIHSGVFNTTDWLRGEGSALKNITDWIADAGLSLVWLGLDELSVWFPLPPINLPPRAPYFDLPEGFLSDAVVGLSAAIATVSHAIWDVWDPILAAVDNGVASASDFLDGISGVPFVPWINFELTENWELVYRGANALTGFAHDMISAGDQFIIDTYEGDGLIAATETALNTTLDSIAARGGEAVQAWVDWGRAQIDYLVDLLTPGSAATLAALQRQTTAPAADATASSTAATLTLGTSTSIHATEHADTAKDSPSVDADVKSDGVKTATAGVLDAAKTEGGTAGVTDTPDDTAAKTAAVTPDDVPAAAGPDSAEDRSSTSDDDEADKPQTAISAGRQPDDADKPAADNRKYSEAHTGAAAGDRNAADHAKVAQKPAGKARNTAEKSDADGHRGGTAHAAHAKGAARPAG